MAKISSVNRVTWRIIKLPSNATSIIMKNVVQRLTQHRTVQKSEFNDWHAWKQRVETSQSWRYPPVIPLLWSYSHRKPFLRKQERVQSVREWVMVVHWPVQRKTHWLTRQSTSHSLLRDCWSCPLIREEWKSTRDTTRDDQLPIIPPNVSAGARQAMNINIRLTRQWREQASRKSDL